jgi:DNA-directed RNA polymerase sigma subunit (sigma70/sigma32)
VSKAERIDLGLALMQRHAAPGVRYSHAEIAAWCGCHRSAIEQIERKALRKVRHRLRAVIREEPTCAR